MAAKMVTGLWSRILLLLASASAGCSTAVLGEVVELRFWAGDKATRDARVVEVTAHCCCAANIALARVAKLPLPTAKGPLMSELVVELNERGNIIRRWPMPVDLVVNGVLGDKILVSLA